MFLFFLFVSEVSSQAKNNLSSSSLLLTKNVMVIDLQKGLYEVTEIFNFIKKSDSILKSKKNIPTF